MLSHPSAQNAEGCGTHGCELVQSTRSLGWAARRNGTMVAKVSSGPEGREMRRFYFAGLKPRAPSDETGWVRAFPHLQNREIRGTLASGLIDILKTRATRRKFVV